MPLRVSYMPIPVPTATPSWFLLTRRKGIVHHNVRSVGGVFPVLVGVLEELMGTSSHRRALYDSGRSVFGDLYPLALEKIASLTPEEGVPFTLE